MAYSKTTTEHYQDVRTFMRAAGQEVPDTFTLPSREVRLLRAKLIYEEAMETIYGLGCHMDMTGTLHARKGYDATDALEAIDGCLDLNVVSSGTLLAFGIHHDIPLQRRVDQNNMSKFVTPACTRCHNETVSTNAHGSYICRTCNTNHGATFGPWTDETGKVRKPDHYEPVNLLPALRVEGYVQEHTPVTDSDVG